MHLCRGCQSPLHDTVIDFGPMPSANAFLSRAMLDQPEPKYPLTVYVCRSCWLMQILEFHKAPDMFSGEYMYFSSYAPSWVKHAARYCTEVIDRFRLNADSFVVEVASNDGYLLQNFVAAGIPCLGIDPAENAAKVARTKGVQTLVDFFGAEQASRIAKERNPADLIIANNVLAHVPDINDFVGGVANLLAHGGVATFEFPHLMQMLKNTQFDTIYDEHFSYLSLGVVAGLLQRRGLDVFDVQELPTHGGSLRVFACHAGNTDLARNPAVDDMLAKERDEGLQKIETYVDFARRAEAIRDSFRAFIAEQTGLGKKIAAFGAAAKGSIFLNYCGVDAQSIDFVIDDTPAKQGRLMPGVHIPVVAYDTLDRERPDLIIILPWNFRDEIARYLEPARAWNARFVVAVPALEVF